MIAITTDQSIAHAASAFAVRLNKPYAWFVRHLEECRAGSRVTPVAG
jgi:hypothetical protein